MIYSLPSSEFLQQFARKEWIVLHSHYLREILTLSKGGNNGVPAFYVTHP